MSHCSSYIHPHQGKLSNRTLESPVKGSAKATALGWLLSSSVHSML